MPHLPANGLLQYAAQRTQATIALEFDVKDKQSRFTYSEVLSFIDLYGSKKTDIDIIQASLIRTVPPVVTVNSNLNPNNNGTGVVSAPTTPIAPKIKSSLPTKIMKVSEYKNWLNKNYKNLLPFPIMMKLKYLKIELPPHFYVED